MSSVPLFFVNELKSIAHRWPLPCMVAKTFDFLLSLGMPKTCRTTRICIKGSNNPQTAFSCHLSTSSLWAITASPPHWSVWSPSVLLPLLLSTLTPSSGSFQLMFSEVSRISVLTARMFSNCSCPWLRNQFRFLKKSCSITDFPNKCYSWTQRNWYSPNDTWSLKPFCGQSRCTPLKNTKTNETFLGEEVRSNQPRTMLWSFCCKSFSYLGERLRTNHWHRPQPLQAGRRQVQCQRGVSHLLPRLWLRRRRGDHLQKQSRSQQDREYRNRQVRVKRGSIQISYYDIFSSVISPNQ